MFESLGVEDVLTEIAVTHFRALAADDVGASRIDAIAALERVIRVAQARIIEQIDGLYQDRLTHIPFGHGDQAVSVVGEVALARGVSPSAANSQFTFMMGLRQLPRVREAFGAGTINELTARALVRETQALTPDDAVLVDGELAEHLPGLTPRRGAELARRLVIEVDTEAAEHRTRKAREDAYVSLIGEADGVATLVAHGPAEQLLVTHQVLRRWADGVRASGDPRSVGQIMVTTLAERVTGQVDVDTTDVELSILMPLSALAGGDGTPELAGYGPITPALAEELTSRAHRAWFRRLLTDPAGELVALDVRKRRFTGQLANWIRLRDRYRCRQPGCECRIRDIDHITPYRGGGPTIAANGQGLCRTSHTLKEQPGWRVRQHADGSTSWKTPTGHTYTAVPSG